MTKELYTVDMPDGDEEVIKAVPRKKEPKIGERYNGFPSLSKFVKDYLPNKLKNNWHHNLFYDILSNGIITGPDGKLDLNMERRANKKVRRERLTAKVNNKILVLAPRFHAKSTVFTINYPLYEIYKNPNVRIMIVSANENIAVSFNRAIMNQLENNEKLERAFGTIVPRFEANKKWGEKAIVVKRNTNEKDPTVTAIGMGGKLISRRADIIILDDVIDMDSSRTKAMRDKTKEWFENVLLPILEPETGRLIIAGTVWNRDDIYDYLWKESHFDIKLKLKALIYNPNNFKELNIGTDNEKVLKNEIKYNPSEYPLALNVKDVFSDSVIKWYQLGRKLATGVLWKEKWSWENLMEAKRHMSNGSFMRQYLNEPGGEEERVFQEKFLRESLANGRDLLYSWDNLTPKYESYGRLITAIGVDLAISKKKTADDTAISVWGLSEQGKRILLWLDIGKFSPDEVKAKVIELYHNFNPVKVMVENVAYQDMMRQDLAKEDIPVEGFHTTSGRKFNEETGLSSMAMLFEQRKVVIPKCTDNKQHADMVKRLMHDLTVYSYDQHAGDSLMSSWFAFEALRDFDKKLASNRGYFSSAALVNMIKGTTVARKLVVFGGNPPAFKLADNSLVYTFRPIIFEDHRPKIFFDPTEKFMIYVTRRDRTVGYIFEKITSEIVGKIEGDITAIFASSMLEKVGRFFNNAQIIMDRTGEGDALFIELNKRNYPYLTCMQPDNDGLPTYGEGFSITSSNLPLSIDYFKMQVDGLEVKIPDESLLKEMSELISAQGDKLEMGFGDGQRLMTVATGLWLLDNYENNEKTSFNRTTKKKLDKKINVRYRVFNY